MGRVELTDAITAMPGGDGWASPKAEAAFRGLAARLVVWGLSPRRAYEALRMAFDAVHEECDMLLYGHLTEKEASDGQ